MDAVQAEFAKGQRNSAVMESFGFRLHQQFGINETYRRAKELEWIESLRQYKGLYDPDVKIADGASRVYPKITRSKVNIVLSRLHEMLFPERDKNWEIEPTPDPKISRETVKQIALTLVKVDEKTKTPIIPTRTELQLAIKKYAAGTCEAMSMVIDDQLGEMDYPEETKKVLRSGLMYGTGVMKGPMVNERSKRLWDQDASGEYVESLKKEEIPYFEAIRLWDWYPDMSVTDIDKMEGSFERKLMTKHDLRQLAKRKDYYPEMIMKYLKDHPDGDYVPRNWETDLQMIEIEAAQGHEGATMSSGTTNVRTPPTGSSRLTGKKYEVLEYWGYVDGSDLEACGVIVDDVSIEYAANVILLGNLPISAKLYEGALDKYKIFYYEKDETSLFGEGLARIMRHSALSIAAGARMVLDNGACVAGPQVEVNYSLLDETVNDLTSFYPRKIWFRTGRGVEAQYPALRIYNVDSHVEELVSIIELFKKFGDEETTLPTWMIGQMVNNETAQASSGRQATITISIKDVVKNFDAFTEKIIQDLYAWNMEFNDRGDIKGDFKVRARGVSSLVMKEIRMQALNQLKQTFTPEDWVYFDRRDFLVEHLKAHDINIRVKTEDEANEARQAQENSKMQQLVYAQMEADIGYKKSQTMGQLTKAKKSNTEATKDASTPPENPNAGEDPEVVAAEIQKIQAEIALIEEKANIARQEADAKIKALQEKVKQDELKTTVGLLQDEKKVNADIQTKKEAAKHTMKLKEKTVDVQGKAALIKARQKPAIPKKASAKKG